jgi:hypothetical protein
LTIAVEPPGDDPRSPAEGPFSREAFCALRDRRVTVDVRNRVAQAHWIEEGSVNKQTTRERSEQSDMVALLPAQLKPLTPEQRAEAVALLADLLLAAARRQTERRLQGVGRVSVFGSVYAGAFAGAYGVAAHGADAGVNPRHVRVRERAGIPTKKGDSTV